MARDWVRLKSRSFFVYRMMRRTALPHDRLSSPAYAGDSVFQSAGDKSRTLWNTGYSAFAAYDDAECAHCDDHLRALSFLIAALIDDAASS